ncbi:Histidine biosynthesis bifunctional protein hisB [Microbotryomycetes sp. JL221]|nr:Histidine biosynthesis bifunctional protein hisB [Microbotryomycetes sp. JL221]
MLYLLDYGAGNVASLANSVRSLGYEFKWVESVQDIERADRILFPGVGSFGSAMASLEQKGYVQPLRDFIKSGKPYMGICIGMQALFESSTESPNQKGLGIIPSNVDRFKDETKSVPSMGWNGIVCVRQIEETLLNKEFGFNKEQDKFYFVHSFRVERNEKVKDWCLTTTRYGDEDYVSSVQKGNVFGTQFHPEKSGQAGLNVLKAWLDKTSSKLEMTDTSLLPLRSQDMIDKELNERGFTKRIVACLDVRTNDDGDLVVTKGDQYDVRESTATTADEIPSISADDGSTSTSLVNKQTKPGGQVRNLGKPVDLAKRYFSEGADEIAFLNITSFRSCPLHDQPMLDVVRQSSETVFVPLTIGGGIRDSVDPDGTQRSALEVAGAYFRSGADKVSIGSDAVSAVEQLLTKYDNKPTGQTSIETISYAYGAQAVVVSFDPKRVYVDSIDQVEDKHKPSVVDLRRTTLKNKLGQPLEQVEADLGPQGQEFCWYQCTVKGGRETRDIDVVELAKGVEKLGAGEILLNSVDKDGSKKGFDSRLINLVKNSVSIPVVASSGAGQVLDFSKVFKQTNVEAALAAGIFHRREVPIKDVKDHLKQTGFMTRIV